MARFYQRRKWHDTRRVTVVYVSAGPCFYKCRLKCSIPSWGFPPGEILLRQHAPIPQAPPDYKTKAIWPIIESSPKSHFILVGDSGEKDPECYGDLARHFRDQVDDIYIRRISGSEACRYAHVFRRIDRRKIHYISGDLAHRKPELEN